MKLHEGVYENLINGQLAYDMKQTEKEGLVCKTEQIDSAESAKILADFLADAIRKKLEDKDIATEEKINFVNDILDSTDIDDNEKLIDAPRLLSAVINQQKNEELKATKKDIIKPLSGFRVSNLFTGGQGGVALGEEIIRDHRILPASLWHPNDTR